MAKCGACGKFLSSTGGNAKKKSRKGDNSSTPVRGISGNTTQEPQMIRSPPCSDGPQKTALNEDDSPARELSRQLVACMVEMRELRKEMA
ncbi:unnamed protein product, partial [Iphiclides podalirius]